MAAGATPLVLTLEVATVGTERGRVGQQQVRRDELASSRPQPGMPAAGDKLRWVAAEEGGGAEWARQFV